MHPVNDWTRHFLRGHFRTLHKALGLCRPTAQTLLFLFILVVLSGCVTVPIPGATEPEPVEDGDIITDISNFSIPNPTPIPSPDATAVVATEGKRANVRSGPGLDFEITAKALPEEVFQILGKNEAGDWLYICCIPGENESTEEASISAWLASSVIRIEGDVDSVPVMETIFPDTLSTEWAVDWSCGSERCVASSCTANVTANSVDALATLGLQIDHEVTWDESCFSTDSWSFLVDPYTGKETTTKFGDNFLYSYWIGPQPGDINSVIKMEDGRQVAAWCSGSREIEIEEGGGWTTVYEGSTCHDINTGMLLVLKYTKRWLFSGEYEDETYDRAYFGDFETLEQKLVVTNANLYFVDDGS